MKNFRSAILFVWDIFLIAAVYYVSFLTRFDGDLDAPTFAVFRLTLAFVILIHAFTFLALRTYSRLWRYLSLVDVAHQLLGVFIGTCLFLLISPILLKLYSFPRSVIFINAALLSIAILISRFAYRFFREELMQLFFVGRERVLIVGAGDAGALLLQDLKISANDKYKIVGFLDDDTGKIGKFIRGLKVLSPVDELPGIARRFKIEEIFVAIPSATRPQINRIIKIAAESGVKIKTIPSTREILAADRIYADQLKSVDLKDLLGRRPAVINRQVVARAIAGKGIVVTGAGGSIGFELCRQILDNRPGRLLLLERDEERLFRALNRIKDINSSADVSSVIADIKNSSEMEKILSAFKPDIVFHAAAYKHVPLGEVNPASYVINNIFGTITLVKACDKAGAGKMVFISTDKAVSPVSIMGATKRAGEEFIRSFSPLTKTSFTIVRFGNVLGSSGSVIETLEEQIRNKSSIFITSKDAKRFFMTVEEAAILSLEAAGIGDTSEIYALDMGQPVKLEDLARDLWFLSYGSNAHGPDIKFTGLRDGDKLEERLYGDTEDIIKTPYDKLLLIKPGHAAADFKAYLKSLDRLKGIADDFSPDRRGDLIGALKEIVPNYTPYDKYLKAIDAETE